MPSLERAGVQVHTETFDGYSTRQEIASYTAIARQLQLVTHDVSEAVALADQVLLIENGQIELDVRITLDRPRERDSGFAHFENLILNRLLKRDDHPHPLEQQRQPSFSI